MEPHPTIWPGINSAPASCDELNGAGLNTIIDAVWWDAAQVFVPLVALRSFWDDVDICIRGENRITTVPHENVLIRVRD